MKWRKLLDALVDDMCDRDGIERTIKTLYSLGVSIEDLENEFDFDKQDIKIYLGDQ